MQLSSRCAGAAGMPARRWHQHQLQHLLIALMYVQWQMVQRLNFQLAGAGEAGAAGVSLLWAPGLVASLAKLLSVAAKRQHKQLQLLLGQAQMVVWLQQLLIRRQPPLQQPRRQGTELHQQQQRLLMGSQQLMVLPRSVAAGVAAGKAGMVQRPPALAVPAAGTAVRVVRQAEVTGSGVPKQAGQA